MFFIYPLHMYVCVYIYAHMYVVPYIRSVAAMSIFSGTAMNPDSEEKVRKGPWLEEEDQSLTATVALLGERRWDALAKASGLRRSGKSCRLRWMNYLKPNLKHGDISAEEENTILQLHRQWGNKWSKIARRLPGRTDNEIKNYWRSHLKNKPHIVAQENVVEMQKVNNGCVDSPLEDQSITTSSTIEFSDTWFASSPFEARVLDRIGTSWPDNHSESCDFDYCFCDLGSFEENDDTSSLWDYSTSIWDLK